MVFNYHWNVSKLLTQLVKDGGTIDTDSTGIRVCAPAREGGPYETLYMIVGGYLYRTERDAFGRRLKLEKLDSFGTWREQDL